MDMFERAWWRIKVGFVIMVVILVIDFLVWLAKNRDSPHLNDYLTRWDSPYFLSEEVKR